MSWKHEREKSRNRCCTYGLQEVRIEGEWYLADTMGELVRREEYFDLLHFLLSHMDFYRDASDLAITLANTMKSDSVESSGRSREQEKPTHVYLARADTGQYKIGFSKTPVERVKHFDVQMPIDVEILHHFPADDARQAESYLHDSLDGYHVTGEWFDLPQNVVDDIMKYEVYRDGQFVIKHETR